MAAALAAPVLLTPLPPPAPRYRPAAPMPLLRHEPIAQPEPVAFADLRDDASQRVGIVVDLARQRAYVFRGPDLVIGAPVSSGRRGYGTPAGSFAILQKAVWHRSTLYSGAPMPYMQRLTWSGVALHAGGVPGYRQSHGCIHLSPSVARRLYGMTRLGTIVVVARRLPGASPVAETVPGTEWAAALITATAL
jgi:lipoprotein-anchoring transpeptidase ErfK/SrfK